MSTYIKKSTLEYPFYQGDIRLLYPEIGEEFVCPDEFEPVVDLPQPSVDKYQVIYEEQPEKIENVWVRKWAITNMTDLQKAMLDTPCPDDGKIYIWDTEESKWTLDRSIPDPSQMFYQNDASTGVNVDITVIE